MADSVTVQKIEKASYAREAKLSMTISLVIGIFMLIIKLYGYFITGSAAILSDAAESVVHNIGVGFAFFSLRLSLKPADRAHRYGHEKISFFSAGFEGMLIVLAAIYIIVASTQKWLAGLSLENIGTGIWVVTIATVVNGVLGFYLIYRGRKFHMLILEANGKHVLTDSWTSFGVIVALVLTRFTGWLPFDPIIAILLALNILYTGGKLMRQSVGGLMDETDPNVDKELRRILKEGSDRFGIRYHNLRHRNTGNKLLVEFHLIFNDTVTIAEAHSNATYIERQIEAAFPFETEVLTHLEPLEAHDKTHKHLAENEEQGATQIT
ncbi:MAG: cation diffusion facilitator family transporter [Bacteroidota bacterium]